MKHSVAIAARNLRGKTGVSAIVLQQTRHLVDKGHSVAIVGEKLDASLIRAAGGTPVKLRRLPGPRLAARRFFSHRFDRLARKHGYDLRIGNSELLHQDVLFMHNLTHMEQECVPGSNSSGLRAKMRFDELLLRAGDYRICIANSELMKQDLVQRHGMDPAKVHVAHPGFDTATFALDDRPAMRAAARQELCSPDDLLIGFITSGHFAKRGADIMLETFQQLPAQLQHKVKLLTVGSLANTQALQNSFAAHGLGVEIIQREKTHDIAPYYHALDLLFYPARMEEFGLVVIEAAACGTPVLTSRATGAAEVLGTDAAYLAEQPAPFEFAPRLATLIDDSNARIGLAVQQQQAVQRHDWSAYFRRVDDLYSQLGFN